MNNQLYREEIMNHFQYPYHCRKPKQFSKSFCETNISCGDQITVYVQLKKDKIINIYYQIKGCAISIASASILSRSLENQTIMQISKLDNETVLKLLKLKLTPTRMKCALLPLVAIKAALK